LKTFIEAFCYKKGQFSRTALSLSIGVCITLFLFLFLGLFTGATFFGWWLVPEFNATAAATVLFTLSSLYVANHNFGNQGLNPDEIKTLRSKVDSMVDSVKGEE